MSELWGHWQLFLSFREDESPFIEKFDLDPNVGWEHICGGAKQIHSGLHPVVRTMKGAGLQFRSVMPSTAQLVCSLWTQTDEFIHIYSLSENFQAELVDCSVHQPKQDTHHLPYMPAGMHGSAIRRGGELYWGEAIAMLKKQAK